MARPFLARQSVARQSCAQAGLDRVIMTLLIAASLPLGGCTTLGSLMSPYSEKFSCKNADHGQCVHPEKAYEDAVAGRAPRSDRAVTRDKKLLRSGDAGSPEQMTPVAHGQTLVQSGAYSSYRDSLYRELKGLIDRPETPMLKPAQAVRTLILPYADRQRRDRLYMPRYVYSILERPSWVVGDYLVTPVSPASQVPVLGQLRERGGDAVDAVVPATALPAPLATKEQRR